MHKYFNHIKIKYMKKNISLVLEGGGMRGAYTAGCLSWFIDEGIEFQGAYGISTGALHLATFLFKNKEWLKTISTEILQAKDNIGPIALIKEGQLVGYKSIFKKMNRRLGFDLKNLVTLTNAYIGLYELNEGKTVYIPIEKVNTELLIAACSLPLLGKVTKHEGFRYLDGGISDMIPIEQAIKDGYSKHFIIATKPLSYSRKPAKKFIVKLMKNKYKDCENISKDYEIRHINYQKQIALIKDLVDNGSAIYRCPSRITRVTRLGGSKDELVSLFEMGRADMENMREEIYNFLK